MKRHRNRRHGHLVPATAQLIFHEKCGRGGGVCVVPLCDCGEDHPGDADIHFDCPCGETVYIERGEQIVWIEKP